MHSPYVENPVDATVLVHADFTQSGLIASKRSNALPIVRPQMQVVGVVDRAAVLKVAVPQIMCVAEIRPVGGAEFEVVGIVHLAVAVDVAEEAEERECRVGLRGV